MKNATMVVNGQTLSYKTQSVPFDKLVSNTANPRSAKEQEDNAKRIYNSMQSEHGEGKEKHRRTTFRYDKFTMYVVATKSGFKVLCGNGSLGALTLWSEADSDSFLVEFPDRKILVTVFDSLSPLETLAIVSDHSSGFESKALSILETAGQFRKYMGLRKKEDVTQVCLGLGYSSGKGKPYYHLEICRKECPVLFETLWGGAIDKDDGNLIRLSHIPGIAHQWAKADGFDERNKDLWKLVSRIEMTGNANGDAKSKTAVEKLEDIKTFNALLSDLDCKNDIVRRLLDALIDTDIGKVNVKIRDIEELIAK